MKSYLILTINLIFLGQISVAQNYLTIDSLYVWAVSGLNMRTTPDLKGEKIMTIPYGTKVKFERSYGEELTLQVIGPQKISGQIFNGFRISGTWAKINYQDTSGYVYGSYLSKYPTIQLLKKEFITNGKKFQPKEYFTEWAERNFDILKIIEERDTIRETNSKKIIYGNSMIYDEFSGGYGSVGDIIIMPNTSFNEGYLLLNILNQLEEPATEDNPIGVKMISDSELKISYGECNSSMKSFANTIILYYECSY